MDSHIKIYFISEEKRRNNLCISRTSRWLSPLLSRIAIQDLKTSWKWYRIAYEREMENEESSGD
jgi:hypothetical protein